MLSGTLVDSKGEARCRRCGGVRPSADPRRLRAVRARGPRPWWWRRSPLLRIAGNLLQVGSDGKLRVKTNGLVVAGASDPCCCSTPCQYCTTTPATIDVSFTSVVACATGCWSNFSFSQSHNLTTGAGTTFAGTWTLTNQGPTIPCNWLVKVPYADIIESEYSGGGCGTLTHATDTLRVSLIRSSATVWILVADIGYTVSGNYTPMGNLYTNAALTNSSMECCTGTVSGSNGNAACSIPSYGDTSGVVASGGSASFTLAC